MAYRRKNKETGLIEVSWYPEPMTRLNKAPDFMSTMANKEIIDRLRLTYGTLMDNLILFKHGNINYSKTAKFLKMTLFQLEQQLKAFKEDYIKLTGGIDV